MDFEKIIEYFTRWKDQGLLNEHQSLHVHANYTSLVLFILLMLFVPFLLSFLLKEWMCMLFSFIIVCFILGYIFFTKPLNCYLMKDGLEYQTLLFKKKKRISFLDLQSVLIYKNVMQFQFDNDSISIGSSWIHYKEIIPFVKDAFPSICTEYDNEESKTKYNDEIEFIHSIRTETSELFQLYKLYYLVVKDGKYEEEGLKFLKEIFRNKYLRSIDEAIILFENKVSNYDENKTPNYRVICNLIIESKKMRYDQRLDLLNGLFEVAYKANRLSKDRLLILREIARFLLINEYDRISLEYMYGYDKLFDPQFNMMADKLEDAYKVLALSETASNQQIKSNYRCLAKKYHPDKLTMSNSEEEKSYAEAKFRAITEAYELLCKVRDIK